MSGEIPVGKITIITETIFSNAPYSLEEGTITGKPRHHGFNLISGGWGLYKINDTDEPCLKYPFRPKHKKQVRVRKEIDIIDWRPGWGWRLEDFYRGG